MEEVRDKSTVNGRRWNKAGQLENRRVRSEFDYVLSQQHSVAESDIEQLSSYKHDTLSVCKGNGGSLILTLQPVMTSIDLCSSTSSASTSCQFGTGGEPKEDRVRKIRPQGPHVAACSPLSE